MAVEMTQGYLEECENDPMLRKKKSAFTRKRKLWAKRLIMILLQRLAMSLQLSLDRFYEFIEEQPVSKQAFSKARGGAKSGICTEICGRNCRNTGPGCQCAILSGDETDRH